MPDRRDPYEDDGRVIINMDVEGMRGPGGVFGWPNTTKRTPRKSVNAPQMTPSEARKYTWYSLLTGLLIGGVFSATWILFVLFCLFIWLRV